MLNQKMIRTEISGLTRLLEEIQKTYCNCDRRCQECPCCVCECGDCGVCDCPDTDPNIEHDPEENECECQECIDWIKLRIRRLNRV